MAVATAVTKQSLYFYDTGAFTLLPKAEDEEARVLITKFSQQGVHRLLGNQVWEETRNL